MRKTLYLLAPLQISSQLFSQDLGLQVSKEFGNLGDYVGQAQFSFGFP